MSTFFKPDLITQAINETGKVKDSLLKLTPIIEDWHMNDGRGLTGKMGGADIDTSAVEIAPVGSRPGYVVTRTGSVYRLGKHAPVLRQLPPLKPEGGAPPPSLRSPRPSAQDMGNPPDVIKSKRGGGGKRRKTRNIRKRKIRKRMTNKNRVFKKKSKKKTYVMKRNNTKNKKR